MNSRLLDNAVNQFAGLPGIGRKTALRLVLSMLRRSEDEVTQFADALTQLRSNVQYCPICHNLSDTDVCPICSNPRRDQSTVCVVENIQDVMQIENTGYYTGVYHVLGGVISPIDGIGPKDIEIDSLVSRVCAGDIREVIFALPTTMEGDTTNFYIYRRLLSALDERGLTPIKPIFSEIARGVAVGNALEYTDEVTLGKSIQNRTEFKQ